MSDKTYPYIGKSEESGCIVLFTKFEFGYCIDGGEDQTGKPYHVDYVGDWSDDWAEGNFKNITREYLANTCGKVESEEHAEFIKLLAEVNGIGTSHHVVSGDLKFFSVVDGVLFFTHAEVGHMKKQKQITIPLPPKEGAKEPEKESEWPAVGDEVVTPDGKGVVKLPKDSTGCYVVSINAVYLQYNLMEMEKPKTPEEELRGELVDIIDNASCSDQAVEYIQEHYNITKK